MCEAEAKKICWDFWFFDTRFPRIVILCFVNVEEKKEQSNKKYYLIVWYVCVAVIVIYGFSEIEKKNQINSSTLKLFKVAASMS